MRGVKSEDPGQVKAQDHDDEPADAGNPNFIEPEKLAQEGGRGPQEKEDPREARHEEEGVNEGRPPVHPFLEVLQGHSRDEGQVAGNQGENARGQEG